MKKTYYDILEVLPTASQEVIRMAYKALILKYHPDTFPGDKILAEEKTKQLNDAYKVLSSPEHRKRYDEIIRQSAVQQKQNYGPKTN